MNRLHARRGEASRGRQRGGFLGGFIVGLLVGLAVALAVALYVTKVPVPFINKVPQRSAEQEATQAEKNRNWEPNAPLTGKSTVRAASAGATGSAPPSVATTPPAPAVAASPPRARPTAAAAPASAPVSTEGLTYFVQAGAYARAEDAEQQRAGLALSGFSARITEREQAGRTVYRVRLGPYERREEAEAVKDRLTATGVEAALVRVQR